MIRKEIHFPQDKTLDRVTAARIAGETSKYDSRIMIEHAHKIVNAKSILGLLSLFGTVRENMNLLVEGPDEEQAA